MNTLFIDANIFFAATASKTGASRALFNLAKHKKLKLFSNVYALKEARVNIEHKLGNEKLPLFYSFISLLYKIDKPIIIQSDLAKIINPKDLPILAGAIKMKADFLISLDKKAFKNEQISQTNLPIKIMLPGEYLQNL